MDILQKSLWDGFHRRWSRLKPPLRPNAEVREAIAEALSGHLQRALLLGVTPELSDIAFDTTAIERSPMTIELIWPGNTKLRRAMSGNWLKLPLRDRVFSSVLGDGSLNCLNYPGEYLRLFGQLSRVLQPGAKAAFRCFLTPDPPESVEHVRNDAMAGRLRSIHGLKWRLAMAITAERHDPNLPVQLIRDVFNREFPDRRSLAMAMGCNSEDIDDIDAYEGVRDIFSFPTRTEILAVLGSRFGNPRFVPSGTYEVADCCPLLVMEFGG